MSDTILVCGACGAELQLVVIARWENGDIQEAEWRCPTDSAHLHAHGWYCDQGTLDLGLVRDSTLNDRFDYEVFADPPPG